MQVSSVFMYVAYVMRWSAAGPDTSIAHVMEGISLFGVTPSLRAIPAGGFVIPAGHFTSEDSPVIEGALMLEEIHAQGLVESGSVVDLGHDAPLEGADASAVDALAGSDHLENIGKFGFQLPFSSLVAGVLFVEEILLHMGISFCRLDCHFL
jgi:hypothetical protein